MTAPRMMVGPCLVTTAACSSLLCSSCNAMQCTGAHDVKKKKKQNWMRKKAKSKMWSTRNWQSVRVQ